MVIINKSVERESYLTKLLKKNIKFRSTIYGQVVYSIAILSIVLFVSFGVIFRSVNENHLNTVIQQNGNNIGSIVEGALYYSMLKNDRSALQNTLDIINTMPGIEDVNMYDSEDNLVNSSFSESEDGHNNPNCKDCHDNIKTMFPRKEKSFRIVNIDSECKMSQKGYDYRLLMIRSPILNEKSCYTADCHAHEKSDEVLGSFVIKLPLENIDDAVQETSTDFFLFAALATLILLLFLFFFTSKKIKNPLHAIITASEAVSRGDKSTRLEIKPNQLLDMRLVSTAFNEMLDNLQSANEELQNWSQQLEYKVQKKSEEIREIQHELIHVERIASLGKLSSSVAHEINNPLSGVLTYTKLVQKQLRRPDLDESTKESMFKYLSVIEKETKRCGDIVKGLLDFSRKDQQDYKIMPLHKILKEVYELMEHNMKMANINFITEYSATSDMINCSENLIKQACIAILLNASEAVDENGEILIKTSNPDKNSIKIEFNDNGVGIAQEDIPHIFEPFFSAKQKASGIGLGLAIVLGIVRSHKGRVDVDSVLSERTTISIVLPIVRN